MRRIVVDFQPRDLEGTVELKIDGGDPLVRFWEQSDKGPDNQLDFGNGLALQVNEMPEQGFGFHAEGIYIGTETMTAAYLPPNGDNDNGDAICEKEMDIHVVSLVETQAGVRRVIHVLQPGVVFTVENGPQADGFTYTWDLGNGNWQDPTAARERTVNYQIPSNLQNQRKEFAVRVNMTGGLELTRNIRVALDEYQGDPLEGETDEERNDEIAGLGEVDLDKLDNPTFDQTIGLVSQYGISLPLTDQNNGAINRLQYAREGLDDPATVIGLNHSGASGNKRIFMVLLSDYAYTHGFSKPSVGSLIDHENRHVEQHVAIRDNVPANNVWRQLDDWGFSTGDGLAEYYAFREADAVSVELNDENVGWVHHVGGNRWALNSFVNRYSEAVGITDGPMQDQDAAARNAARELLQEIYEDLPFPEMKRAVEVGGVQEYWNSHTVRPPE